MKKTIVFSCSGCSSAGQMANRIALRMDRAGIAEMSCIAGIGAGLNHLVKKAMEADEIIGIDGCPMNCVQKCLSRQNLECTHHYDLSKWGVEKLLHADFDERQADSLEKRLLMDVKFRKKVRV